MLWIALALYAAGIGLSFIVCKDNWTAIQTWAVVLTGVVLIWYSWETMRLREVAFSQREIQLRPFVVLELKKKQIEITNIGVGVALNVKIKEVTIDKEHDIIVRFPAEGIAVLRSGETQPVQAESFKKGTSVGDFFLAHLNNEYANQEIELKIEFQNIEMKSYSVSERVVPGQLRMKGFS
jgi:hypothetical protein